MQTISVVIPTYNSEKFLVECLDSVRSQTKPPLEIIICDNGSSDGTLSLIKSYMDRYQDFSLKLIHTREPGAGPNRNNGVRNTIGDLISFIDSDDVWNPNFLERMTNNYVPKGVIRGSFARYTNATGKIFGASIFTSDDNSAEIGMLQKGRMPALLSSWVMQREQFLDLDGFDERFVLSQDFEFLMRFLKQGGKLSITREFLLMYRIHVGSESTQTHLMQRISADYVRQAKESEGQTFESYLNQMSYLRKMVLKRQQISDSSSRKFVIAYDYNFILAFVHLIIAFFFAPIRFSKKIWNQKILPILATQLRLIGKE